MHADLPWYTNAVIYGVDVSKFADGNGDGVGDFVGLADRLPYLRELGVTCIWLLPFYKTPGRDNGYDISDYLSVDPRLGTMADFTAFLHKAGEQGIRVLADLVVNHTSDEHPWFRAARNSRQSLFRHYYLWSDEPPPVDVGEQSALPGDEDSVWQFDYTAQAYYFHKFRHFQPDLNIANPDVRAEILRIADFWLALAVSGFRVDAAPFVMTDNGFARSQPADPHGLLRSLHDLVLTRVPEGLLLGEVNLEADKLAAFFGNGDQLGMLYSFIQKRSVSKCSKPMHRPTT